VGEKEKVGLLRQQVCRKAVGQLRRIAEGGALLVKAGGLYLLRQQQSITELAKEAVEKREIGIGEKGAVHADRRPAVGGIIRGQVPEHAPFAPGCQVEACGVDLALMDEIVVAVADAAKRIDLIAHPDAGDLAATVALPAAAADNGFS